MDKTIIKMEFNTLFNFLKELEGSTIQTVELEEGQLKINSVRGTINEDCKISINIKEKK